MDWRDYVRQAHVKQLIESKGVEAARQQYIRESNKALWDDPFIINETKSPGTSVASNNSAAVGSTPSIIGDTAEVSRFQWTAGVSNNITGSHPLSGSLHGLYIDVPAYNGTVDYSFNHVNSTKVFRLYVVSSSDFAPVIPANINGVITASYTHVSTADVTGSIVTAWREAINNQSSTAQVIGFTNTIAPNTLYSASIDAAKTTLTITHINEGGAPDISSVFTTTTASVSVTTQGLDKYYNSTGYYTGAVKFDGAKEPYTTLARKG